MSSFSISNTNISYGYYSDSIPLKTEDGDATDDKTVADGSSKIKSNPKPASETSGISIKNTGKGGLLDYL